MGCWLYILWVGQEGAKNNLYNYKKTMTVTKTKTKTLTMTMKPPCKTGAVLKPGVPLLVLLTSQEGAKVLKD